MKLVLMLAIGTAFYPDRGEFERIRRLAQTWIYAAQWWLAGPSENSTLNLDGLQVFCLLLLARQTNSLGQFHVALNEVSGEDGHGDGLAPRPGTLPGVVGVPVRDATATLGHRSRASCSVFLRLCDASVTFSS